MKIEQKMLPEGWFMTDESEQKYFVKELNLELPEEHLLFDEDVVVIAHRDGATDDILCQHVMNQELFTVVHLTWRQAKEIDSKYPMVESHGSFNDFLKYENQFGDGN